MHKRSYVQMSPLIKLLMYGPLRPLQGSLGTLLPLSPLTLAPSYFQGDEGLHIFTPLDWFKLQLWEGG